MLIPETESFQKFTMIQELQKSDASSGKPLLMNYLSSSVFL